MDSIAIKYLEDGRPLQRTSVIARRFEQTPNWIRRPVHGKALYAAGKVAARQARRICPVGISPNRKTGRLRDSIRVYKSFWQWPQIRGNRKEVKESRTTIVVHSLYALFVERGTKHYHARPFLKPSVESENTFRAYVREAKVQLPKAIRRLSKLRGSVVRN